MTAITNNYNNTGHCDEGSNLTQLKRADKESRWWNDVERAAKESIERGLKQAKEGKVIPHDQVMKKYKKWLSK